MRLDMGEFHKEHVQVIFHWRINRGKNQSKKINNVLSKLNIQYLGAFDVLLGHKYI